MFFCEKMSSPSNGGGFTEAAMVKKLENVNHTMQSIQTMGMWLIHHRKHSKRICEVWLKVCWVLNFIWLIFRGKICILDRELIFLRRKKPKILVKIKTFCFRNWKKKESHLNCWPWCMSPMMWYRTVEKNGLYFRSIFSHI